MASDSLINLNIDSSNTTGGADNISHILAGHKFKPWLDTKVGGGVIVHTNSDGSEEIANVNGIPKDSLGFIKNNSLQRTKKKMARKHAQQEMWRRQAERESKQQEAKQETIEEANARFEILVELIGLEDAKRQFNEDFWENR